MIGEIINFSFEDNAKDIIWMIYALILTLSNYLFEIKVGICTETHSYSLLHDYG